MALVNVADAAQQLGVSTATIKRRIKRGDLLGQQQSTPQGYVWMVEIDEVTQDHGSSTTNGSSVVTNDVTTVTAVEVQRLEQTVALLQQQLVSKDQELETRQREVQELHVLLQQTHEQVNRMLPAPRLRRWWWPFS